MLQPMNSGVNIWSWIEFTNITNNKSLSNEREKNPILLGKYANKYIIWALLQKTNGLRHIVLAWHTYVPIYQISMAYVKKQTRGSRATSLTWFTVTLLLFSCWFLRILLSIFIPKKLFDPLWWLKHSPKGSQHKWK